MFELSQLGVDELLMFACADQRRRWRGGDCVTVETYVSENPSLAACTESLLELAFNEFCLQAEWGGKAELAEFEVRFPQIANPLRALVESFFRYTQDQQADDPIADDSPDDEHAGHFKSTVVRTIEFVRRDSGPHAERRVRPRADVLAASATPQLEDYEILHEVARGGMGIVYKACQRSLDRIVALKMIRSGHLADDNDVQRFYAEAKAAATLQHPNIVSVHQVGQSNGQHFFSMELVDGTTLSKIIRENPLPADRAARYVAEIAAAMQYAHDKGILHRDLKPSNVLIDTSDSVRITDFGLAKRVTANDDITFPGAAVGTPSYMPPEQVRGRADLVGPPSDVYSMGALLYELLTGRAPFRAASAPLTFQQILTVDAVSPRTLNPSIPLDVATICLKCLEKDPSRRYATAAELAADLRRFLHGEPTLARPTGFWERLAKWAKRRPAIATLSAAVLLVSLLGLSGVVWQWRKAVTAQERTARSQLELLLSSEPQVVSSVIANLAPYRQWIDPWLEDMLQDPDLPERERFRVNLGLLPVDPGRIEYFLKHVLTLDANEVTGPDELRLAADALSPRRGELASPLWTALLDKDVERNKRFRSAMLLAKMAPLDQPETKARWHSVSYFVADELMAAVTQHPNHFSTLRETFSPVGSELIEPLRERASNAVEIPSKRLAATNLLAAYAQEQFELLADLIVDVQGLQHAILFEVLQADRTRSRPLLDEIFQREPAADASAETRDADAKRRASAAITLLMLGQPAAAWQAIEQRNDPALRSNAIPLFAVLDVDPTVVAERLKNVASPFARQALIQCLGDYDATRIRTTLRTALIDELQQAFHTDLDPGVHSACAWTLRKWGLSDWLSETLPELKSDGPSAGRRWYVSRTGIPLSVVVDPADFPMGSPDDEPSHTPAEAVHSRRVGRSFAIATTEVTRTQFELFVRNSQSTTYTHPEEYGPDPDGPAIGVSWIQALKFCRWLSEQEQVPEAEMCLPPLDAILDDFKFADNQYLKRTGFRLPTESEWECACRGGTVTPRFFGHSAKLLSAYAWFQDNSQDRAWPVGLLKPNEYGLFDVYGNVWEWCQDFFGTYPVQEAGRPAPDNPRRDGGRGCVLRGGSLTNRPEVLRSAQRDYLGPTQNRNHNVGFRVARTIRVDGSL